MERLHVVTNPNRLLAPRRGLLVEAHRDDASMAVIDVPLAKRGVGLSILTLSDGSARGLGHTTANELIKKRIVQGNRSAKLSGAADVYYAGLPDGNLHNHPLQIREAVAETFDDTKPDFVIVTNFRDPHKDHEEAAKAVIGILGYSVPIYLTDTISGYDGNGVPIPHTHVIPISRRADRRRKRAHMTHETQVTGLPQQDLRDVNEVLRMPQRIAHDLAGKGVKFAGAVELLNPQLGDPVSEIMGGEIYIRELAMAS